MFIKVTDKTNSSSDKTEKTFKNNEAIIAPTKITTQNKLNGGVNLAKFKDAMGDNPSIADVGVIWFQESPPHVTFTHKNGHP